MNTKKTNDCKTIAVAIQKGGVAKTTSSIAISAILAEQGYRVLLIDNDPQHNSTRALIKSNSAGISIATIISNLINNIGFDKSYGILQTNENFDIMPGSDEYAGIEFQMISIMNREYFMKKYIDMLRAEYDYIIIDCPPNIGMLTINALVAADEMLIPAQPQDYSATSIYQILNTVKMVWQFPNPNLKVGGIFLTMFDSRRNEDRFMKENITKAFDDIKVFDTVIPYSVRVSEAARHRQSIIKYDKKGKVTQAYKHLVEEVLSLG